MTAVSLLCDQCNNAITGDPHWPHNPHCGGTTDPSCTCSNIVCLGCCADCTPNSGPILLDESDAPVAVVSTGANSGDGSSRAGPPTGDAAPDTTAASPSPDTSDDGLGSARPPTGSAISTSPTEDRVVDLMAALEESVAAAKAARASYPTKKDQTDDLVETRESRQQERCPEEPAPLKSGPAAAAENAAVLHEVGEVRREGKGRGAPGAAPSRPQSTQEETPAVVCSDAGD